MISFTKVTWYSQAAAIAVALLIFGVGFYVGTLMPEEHPVATPIEIEQEGEEPITDDEPTFQEQRIQGTYTGYFDQIEREGWGVEVHTCDIFVVEQGDEQVLGNIRESIARGNTLSTLSADGKVRINLPHEMSSEARSQIEQSTAENPITIELVKEPQESKGVGPCYSIFSFVRIVR